ncbi:MAG: MDR family MFS transporter [Anaerolineales bacterium]
MSRTVIQQQINQWKGIYREYPSQFWTLIGASFIDALGGALLFPFFTLYITAKFEIGMTKVGMIFGLLSVASIVGNTIGGGLTDKIGRKGMVIFGLIASAFSVVAMGLVESLLVFVGITIFVGLFANAGGPARQAMIADLLPEEKRAQGFGVFRVMHNLAVTMGPAIGGLLAAQSYLLLFLLDALASTITAVIVYLKLQETKPEPVDGEPSQSMLDTFRGYGRVLADSRFMIFFVATGLMVLVYTQMNGTLAVFLRDFHGIPERGFGYILSLNAGMVVLFQFAITRRVEGKPPFLVLAAGTALYAVGFGLYGLVSAYSFFLVAMAIITIGEMLTAPVGQSVAAQMAPDAMRGRYMAVYGFSWILPSAAGLYLAGLIMDNLDPRWVWYAAGLLALLPAAVFYLMHRRDALESAEEAAAALSSAQVAAEEAIRAA